MHRHCPLRTHERWTSNVSDSEINYRAIFNLPLECRCAHRDTLARIEFGSEESRQRHRRLPRVPHRSQPADKEDRMVSQQSPAALVARHHHHESVAGAADDLEADARPVHVSGGEHSRQRQQQRFIFRY